MTSWTQLLNEDLMSTNHVTHALLVGTDGTVWADSGNWSSLVNGGIIDDVFLNKIVTGFENRQELYDSGIDVEETHFYITNIMDDYICGKKGVQGLYIYKSKTALLLCMYGLDQQPGEALIVTENFTRYLIEQDL
ncbi:profilin [Acrasis kona]|uniref:Profilin n=1 Tax=Acrasis kona TaxID=1008807 RepID=A0AAW2YKU3_9EUKA